MCGSLSLRKSYLLLILFTIIFSGLSWFAFSYREEWFSAYLSNIASGIVGSMIIIFLVDLIIARNREKERLRVLKVALQRLRIPIIWQMRLLCNIYKAAAQNKPTPLPSTFEGTFTGDYIKEISFLDFTKDAPVIPKRDWFTHLDLMTKTFKEKLEQVVGTYAASLDVRLIEILERIINSHFVYFITQLKNLPSIDKQYGFKRVGYTMFSGIEQFVKEHVSNMLELVEYFNSISDVKIQLHPDVWRDDVAPKWGSGRVSQEA